MKNIFSQKNLWIAISALLLLSGCSNNESETSRSASITDTTLLRSFGSDGYVEKSFGTNTMLSVTGLAVDHYDDIYVTANIRDDMWNMKQIASVKYYATGTLDQGYGQQAMAAFPQGDLNLTNGIAIVHDQGDEESVIVGTVRVQDNTDPRNNWYYLPKIWKFDKRGQLDSTFNRTGVLYDANTSFGAPQQVLTDGERNIYLLGSSFTSLLGVKTQINGIMKLGWDGSLDETFGNLAMLPGILSFEGETGASISQMVFDHQGNIVVAGIENQTDGYHIVMMRFTSGGVLDTSFANNGIARDERAFTPCAQDVEGVVRLQLTEEDRIGIIGGRCENNVMSMFLRYYDSNGTFNEDFNRQAGEVTWDSDDTHHTIWRDMVIDEFGNFYIVGDIFEFGSSGHGQHMAVWQYNRSGDAVHGFGTNGLYKNANEACYGRKIKFDINAHHLVVAGECNNVLSLWKLNK